jgi:hypothetical protein
MFVRCVNAISRSKRRTRVSHERSHSSPSPEDASPQQIFRAILATDFRAFVDYVFGLLRPGTSFKPNWHIDAMAYKAAQVASGEVKRLIIAVPPRHRSADTGRNRLNG